MREFSSIFNKFLVKLVYLIMNIFLCLFFLIVILCYANSVILHTKQGTLKGKTLSSRDGRPFYAFYNIPYAEPPIGELRFESPVPAKPWKGIRDATELPPACISYEDYIGEIVGQEDCLYLNVYSSKINNDTLLPVLVFIYGGRFMYGNALPDRYGAHYFMDKDVILITFHYRLGALGFLSTEDEVIPGNYGLKDGIAVLEWVQKYIEAFGGDKSRVTLLGGSSGAISASLTLLSPLAKGLFHRVITQSGHPFDMEKPGAAKRNAWKFASFVDCNDESVSTSEALKACLKKIPADKIIIHNAKLFTFGYLLPVLPWSPVIENEKVPGAFLVDSPSKLLARQTDIPWIMGFNSEDGGMIAIFTYFSSESSIIKQLDENYDKYFPWIFRYGYHANNSEHLAYLTKTYKEYYFGDKTIRENIHGFSKMFTCMIYLNGIREVLKLYRGPKYVYYYEHRNKESFARTYGNKDEDMGVVHGDELISIFNWSSVIKPVTEGVDLTVSKQILQLWTNFAAKGDPNNENEQLWRPVDSSHINYLHIKDGILEMKEALLKSEFDFLDSVPVDGYF